MGVKGGLEVYGGVGCVLASVGVYGAGSIEYQEEMYPNAEAEHLILAGEIGLKAKLFGKVLACFKIVSGSHDFVFDKKKSWLGLQMSDAEIRQYFLSSGYGSQKGVLLKPGANFVWYGENIDLPSISNDWERDRGFSHLLARDIYPDSHVQIVSSGQNSLSMMNLAFLGNGSGRSDGNNSTLMSSYYNLATEFVSEPVPVSDDGTADYEPYLYGNADGVVLAVWQNASSAIRPEMTFSEIAETLDLYMAENTSGNFWYPAEQVTSYAGSGKFPSGARIAADSSRQPFVAYYTNSTEDPMGLSGSHEVCLAVKENNAWKTEVLTEVQGTVTGLECALWGGFKAVAVSWKDSEDGNHVTLWRENSGLSNYDDIASAQFLEGGYETLYLTYYESGQIKKMNASGDVSDVTPSDILIPSTEYQIRGKLLGGSSAVIFGTSLKDTTADAFAYISSDGGSTWGKADLTKLSENAYVSHVDVGFTDQYEPVVLYSVQNYQVNVDLENPSGDGSAEILLGEEDSRFTDTQSDLYISARQANRHLSIESAKTLHPEDGKPGGNLSFELTLRNTGLYSVDHAVITSDGETVSELSESLAPGEVTSITVQRTLPWNPGTESVSYSFEVSTHSDGEPESRITVEANPGYLTASTTHAFRFGEESVKYRVDNHGYTDKTARIIVRDESTGETLSEKTVKIDGGFYSEGEYKATEKVFSQQGLENVTLYVLFDDEEIGDSDISVNRIKSVIPLDEIYAQEELMETSPSGLHKYFAPPSIYIGIGTAALIAGTVITWIFVRKKHRRKNS